MQSELSKTLEATANAEKFMKVVRKYTSFEELTPPLLREFVEKIESTNRKPLTGNAGGSFAGRKSKSNILLSAKQNCPTKARPVRPASVMEPIRPKQDLNGQCCVRFAFLYVNLAAAAQKMRGAGFSGPRAVSVCYLDSKRKSVMNCARREGR